MLVGKVDQQTFKNYIGEFIMLYFRTRKYARDYAGKKAGYKVVDNGTYAKAGRRWGVKVL